MTCSAEHVGGDVRVTQSGQRRRREEDKAGKSI